AEAVGCSAWLGADLAIGCCPIKKDNQNVFELPRTTVTSKSSVADFAPKPIRSSFRLALYRRKRLGLKRGTNEIDCNAPTRIVQCVNIDAIRVFPYTVALRAIPSFESQKSKLYEITVAIRTTFVPLVTPTAPTARDCRR